MRNEMSFQLNEFIRRQLGCDRTYNHTSLEIGIKEEEKKNKKKTKQQNMVH